MVQDNSLFTLPEAPAADDRSVLPVAESRRWRFFVVLGRGAIWAFVLGGLAFSYGLYNAAVGQGSSVVLLVLAAVSIGLIVLFWHYERPASLINYEAAVFAVWLGYRLGATSLTYELSDSLTDLVRSIKWLCLFSIWIIWAVVGGLLVASRHGRRPNSLTARTTRAIALVALATAGGLLVYQFTSLLLFENRPSVEFSAFTTGCDKVPYLDFKDMAFSPDGRTLATIGGWDREERRTARLWDAATGTSMGDFKEEQGEEGSLPAIGCLAVGFVAAQPGLVVAYGRYSFNTVPYPGSLAVRVWDTTTRKVQQRFQWGDDRIFRPVFSRNGRLFVYSDSKGNIRVFNLLAGRVAAELVRNKGDSDYPRLALTPECDRLACTAHHGKVEVWDLAAAKQESEISVDEPVFCMSLSPGGRLLACGTEGGQVEIIDINAAGRTTVVQCFDDGAVHAVAFSPDGTLLACGGRGRGITKIVETRRWEVVATLRTWGGWPTSCLAFSPDGKRLATGHVNGRVAVWEVLTLKLEQ